MSEIGKSLTPMDKTGESTIDLAFEKEICISPDDVAGVLHKMYRKSS